MPSSSSSVRAIIASVSDISDWRIRLSNAIGADESRFSSPVCVAWESIFFIFSIVCGGVCFGVSNKDGAGGSPTNVRMGVGTNVLFTE